MNILFLQYKSMVWTQHLIQSFVLIFFFNDANISDDIKDSDMMNGHIRKLPG